MLRPAVLRYLGGNDLDTDEVELVRLYLAQWIDAELFRGPLIDDLRRRVGGLRSTSDLQAWVRDAADAGVDPF